jgi:hypothetical protein
LQLFAGQNWTITKPNSPYDTIKGNVHFRERAEDLDTMRYYFRLISILAGDDRPLGERNIHSSNSLAHHLIAYVFSLQGVDLQFGLIPAVFVTGPRRRRASGVSSCSRDELQPVFGGEFLQDALRFCRRHPCQFRLDSRVQLCLAAKVDDLSTRR